MRSSFVAIGLMSSVVACAGRAHPNPSLAPDSTARYYTDPIVVRGDSGRTPGVDSRSRISRDSALALLGDFLFKDLQHALANARIDQPVAVADWSRPAHTVFAMRTSGDTATPRGPLVTNGSQVSIAATARRGITYADLAAMMKDLHMNPDADYAIDTTRSTGARARALLDSGLVLRIDFIKPGTSASTGSATLSSPNGLIRILIGRRG